MRNPPRFDYLAIGHVAKDITDDGPILGGTVSYAGRTALSMGYRVGVITSCMDQFDLSLMEGIQLHNLPSEKTTTFENVYSNTGRTQIILSRASDLGLDSIPKDWRSVKIIHLGPIAGEVDPKLMDYFTSTFIGITPQGWMRDWDSSGHIRMNSWETIKDILTRANAVVLSFEDLNNDKDAAQEMAHHCSVLAVTNAAQGATVFYEGQCTDLPGLQVKEIDSTGAGDIFAAAFFIRLHEMDSPIEAGQFANAVASASITRRGVQSTPTPAEIKMARSRIHQ